MKPELTTRQSEPAAVDAYMTALDHPLADVLEALRQVILAAHPEIGEEIKWNAPSFFFTGEMALFNPKEYKRHLVNSNVFQKNCIRLIFLDAGKLNDASGFLKGDYADGRRLAKFYSVDDVMAGTPKLQEVLREQIRLLDQFSKPTA